jgi:hypothetical protein
MKPLIKPAEVFIRRAKNSLHAVQQTGQWQMD